MDIQSSILTSSAGYEFKPVLLIIMIILIFCSAFFSMSETAFSSCNLVKLQKAVEDRKRGAKKAIHLAERFEKTVTTLLIGNNLVNTALSTVAVGFFGSLLINTGLSVEFMSTLIITVALLIFGEIVPKMIAKNNPETIARTVSYIVYIISILFYPISFIFMGLQKLLKKNEDESEMDENELEILIRRLMEDGVIEEDESEMIFKIFDLKERSAEDIMVPRIMMEAIDYASSLEEVKEFMIDTCYSRIPVYKKDRDHIVGILYERDFLKALAKNPKMSWKRLIKPVKFVSGAMKIDDLIRAFQEAKTHMFIVSGEYGDVLGLVTFEDALEQIVGEIYDETDIPGEDDLRFEVLEDGSYLVDAEFFVEDLFDKLYIANAPEDVPNKISGWLFAKCESLPQVGFEFEYLASYTMYNDEEEVYSDYNKILTFSIAEVEDRRISLVKVVIRDATEEEIEKFSELQD
ncbi:MAG: HlyC/CorC family transporter [Acholeplasmatales bacterium]|nr:HlyC/CorC family transporter [Acholeplasmatales bacterium]